MKEQEAKDDYIPFGDEWKKEINQFSKPALIDCVATMLSDKTADNQRLREALERIREVTKVHAMRTNPEVRKAFEIASAALGGEK